MRLFLLVLSITVTSARINVTDDEWKEYKRKWGKEYPPDNVGVNPPYNDGYHRGIFENSRNTVDVCNERFREGKFTFKCKLNSRSDNPRPRSRLFRIGLDPAQANLLTKYAYKLKPHSNRTRRSVDYKDWSKEGAVTAAVDQGDCQSCYAFAVTGAIESHYYIHSRNLVKLSEQQIVDCTNNFTEWQYGNNSYPLNQGCNYGMTDPSIQYFEKLQHDFNYAEDYPYIDAENGQCLYDPDKRKVKVGTLKVLHNGTEEDIKNIVANVGPVAATLDVLSRFFLHYAEGVYDYRHCNPLGINHAVVIVGFGTTKEGIDYWKFKNSWGPDWGMNGFGYIRRNKNTCGIANFISYPDYSNVALPDSSTNPGGEP